MTKGTIDQLLDALKLDIELTDKQRERFEVIEWLFGSDTTSMKSGRTLLLALHAIKTAMERPGTRIYLVDHEKSPSGQEALKYAIRRLLSGADDKLRRRFVLGSKGLTFDRYSAQRIDITYGPTRPVGGGFSMQARVKNPCDEIVLGTGVDADSVAGEGPAGD